MSAKPNDAIIYYRARLRRDNRWSAYQALIPSSKNDQRWHQSKFEGDPGQVQRGSIAPSRQLELNDGRPDDVYLSHETLIVEICFAGSKAHTLVPAL